MSFLSGVLSFIEAVPIIEKWFNRLMKAYTDRQISKHRSKYDAAKSKRHAYLDAIEKVIKDQHEGIGSVDENRDKILHYRRLLIELRE